MMQSKSRAGSRLAASLLCAAMGLSAPSAVAHPHETLPIQPVGTGPNDRGPVKITEPPADRSAECSDECLTAIADLYLDALERRDYSALPVAANLEVTENAYPSRIGEGLWKVLEKLNDERSYLTDPVSGNVLVLTTVEESAGETLILLLRLKVEDRKIAEVETMLTSDLIAAQHFMPENVPAFDPVAMSVLPADQQPTREELLENAQRWYYDEGEGLTVSEACVHWENAEPLPQFNCSVGKHLGGRSLAMSVRGVRNPIVDPERGLVVTFLLEDTTPYINPDPPDHERTPLFYRNPMTFYQVQIAKFGKGGELLAHHVFMNAQGPGAPTIFFR